MRSHRLPHVVGLMAIPLLAGCAVSMVKSQYQPRLPNQWADAKGITYFLPKGMVEVDATWNKEVHEWTIKVSSVIEPDKDYRFVLKRRVNSLFDDDLSVVVDSKGLLQTVSGTSADKTVSAIGALAAAAASAYTFGAALAAPVLPNIPQVGINEIHKEIPAFKSLTKDQIKSVTAPPSIPVYSFHVVFDPQQTRKIADLPALTVPECNLPGMNVPDNKNDPCTKAAPIHMRFQITAERLGPDQQPDLSQLENLPDNTPVHKPPTVPGVVVREAALYAVRVSPAPEYRSYGSVPPAVVLLPDRSHSYVLPIERQFPATDTTVVGFGNGTVQSLHTTRPSVVAGIIGIPKTILSALVPIPITITNNQDAQFKAMDDALKVLQDQYNLQHPKQ